MFFISTALYPLRKLEESSACLLHRLASHDSRTHSVEATRLAPCGKAYALSLAVAVACTLKFFGIALWSCDTQLTMPRRSAAPKA